jgi:4-carboxymuconolactone decarboxylase
MDTAQKELYDRVVTGRRAAASSPVALTDAEGRLLGPFDPMLRSPAVGRAMEALGAALRYESSLAGDVRELATLAIAAHWKSDFEWFAHQAIACHMGISDDAISAIGEGRMPDGAGESQAVGVDTVRSLVEHGDLDDESYNRALGVLGEQAVFELVALAGHYTSLAMVLRVFGINRPD